MENFTLLSLVTPEVAVLLRAALVAALLFGLEALSSAKRRVGCERAARKEVRQPEHAGRKQRPKERIVRA